jgi:hypothetical protein
MCRHAIDRRRRPRRSGAILSSQRCSRLRDGKWQRERCQVLLPGPCRGLTGGEWLSDRRSPRRYCRGLWSTTDQVQIRDHLNDDHGISVGSIAGQQMAAGRGFEPRLTDPESDDNPSAAYHVALSDWQMTPPSSIGSAESAGVRPGCGQNRGQQRASVRQDQSSDLSTISI